MLSEAQIKRAWEGMLGAEIRANYFADLSQRYSGNQRTATWGTLFLSSGAFLTFIRQIPGWLSFLPAALMLGAAGLSLYSVVAQNQKHSVDSADLHMRWNRLAHDFQLLWENVHAEDALQTLDQLCERAIELSKVGTAFPNNSKHMLKWEIHVVEHHGLELQPLKHA
jgi:hypothetical protein